MTKKIINVEKDEIKDDFDASSGSDEEGKDSKTKRRKRPEWGRILLVEDKYPSSDSEEGAKVKEIHSLTKSKNILNKKMSENVIELTEKQKEILEKVEEREALKLRDENMMKKKRAQTMELFMDLDKNNDNFVDRKDLIKYYGMLHRIKGASVIPQYKCKQGHKMKIVVHD